MPSARPSTKAQSSPAPARRPGRPSRAGAAMSREALLQQAFTAFAQHGYDGVSLRQLAQDCGVSDSLLSHHFGSKQELWHEAADSVFGPLYQRMVQTLESIAADNIALRLRQNLTAALRLMATEAEAMAFMFRENDSDSPRAQYLREHYLLPYIRRIHALVDQATAQGLMRKLSHEACTGIVLGVTRMLVQPGLYRPMLAPHLATPERMAAYIDDIVTIFYDGLLLPTPPLSAHPSGSRP